MLRHCEPQAKQSPSACEVNFDGLVGPTHNYSGLAFGNVASMGNKGLVSSPRRAALQGLTKMKFLHDLGLKQAILPPQPRPALSELRDAVGIASPSGLAMTDVTDDELLRLVSKSAPQLLSASYSASSMWTANAATVSPSADTADGRLHFTIANLISSKHRAIEAAYTCNIFKQIFADEKYFAIHPAVGMDRHAAGAARDDGKTYGDEGAANHCRFATNHGASGIELFVYGSRAAKRYPARQSLTASMLVAEQHGLRPERCIFAEQSAQAIDAGVFHNDVISVANERVFLYHEAAFTDTERVIAELRDKWSGSELYLIKASDEDLSLDDAVRSYLYNSQLITMANGEMLLVAPLEARENPNTYNHIQKIISADNPISRVEFMDLRESMRNGGGPACLRLRVVMTDTELAAMQQSVLFTDRLYAELKACVESSYREELSPDDLLDLKFSREALDVCAEIYKILGLGV